MSRRQTAVFGLLATAGLALYLWPALTAPVVEWSDSTIDLEWARQGLGIFRPVWTLGHAAKPGYLLFLRGALGLSGGNLRGIVVAQSLLVWGSIVLSAFLLLRRRGAMSGIAFCAVMFALLRLRDASSSIMSEPISAALFLPIVVVLLDPPLRYRSLAVLGIAEGVLFLVRPNLGAVALLLSAARLVWVGRWRALAAAAAPAILLILPFWIATSPDRSGDRARGLTFQMFEASADDYWLPSIAPTPQSGTPAEISGELRDRARANWKRTLSQSGPDARRQLVWRALHGLFGAEFYDARWSRAYRALTTTSRVMTPFALLAAVALVLAAPLSGESLAPKILGLLLLAILVGQNLVLGSNPRYVLPFLPALLLLALCALPPVVRAGVTRMGAALLVFAVATGLVATHRSVLGWEWGVIESTGVKVEQPIPARSLPKTAPATLHVRIASPLLPTSAGLEVRAGSELLYSSERDSARQRPEVTVMLPQALLDANRAGPVSLELHSTGSYDPTHYLLFPVIPPPWGRTARREGSPELSPASGVARGALDWWAHAGGDPERRNAN